MKLCLLYRVRPRLIERALALFTKRFWSKPAFPVFPGFQHWREAKFYAHFLLALGTPEDHIRIILHSHDKRIEARWRRHFALSTAQYVCRRETNKRSHRAATYVGVEPLFPQNRADGEKDLKAARGFRIALAFAARELYRIHTAGYHSAETEGPGGTALSE